MSATATLALAYRPLTEVELILLERSGCTAEDWSRVEVADNFNPRAMAEVELFGRVRLGGFHATVPLPAGLERPSGVYRATLSNCTVGHNVLIRNVGRYIANYDIADNAVIDNVGLLAVEGETAFGNGTRVNVLNEAGGREVPIFDRLSAQLAYLLAVYRHETKMVNRLQAMIDEYARQTSGPRGEIGAGAWIVNCGELTNLRVGPAAKISGATRLSEGTVNSRHEAPTKIGDGVFAERFIVSTGSILDSGASVSHSFVGQGVKLARGFSAEHCLFFAGSEGLQGEACSVFAGPFTVTHHKSTLLIAGLFSFFNAGSGTNQSNHMYKLGPVHQGVVHRGGKTGSDSYLLWPSRVGAFTTVIGSHKRNVDTSAFPFSYLLEQDGQSVLIPGMNLYTVGTRRDAAKWPQRDWRTDSDQLDLLHFDELNPYTAGAILRGRSVLKELQQSSAGQSPSKYVSHGGAQIPTARLARSIGIYDMAVFLYLGRVVARRLDSGKQISGPEEKCNGEWADLCGMLAPQQVVGELVGHVAQDSTADLPAIEEKLRRMHGRYDQWEWEWAMNTWLSELGKSWEEVSREDLAKLIDNYKNAVRQRHNWLLRDAEQEFSKNAHIGYGLDGEESAAREDFRSVRGAMSGNTFVQQVGQETAAATALADRVLQRLGGGSPTALVDDGCMEPN